MNTNRIKLLLEVNPGRLEEKYRSREIRGRVEPPFIVRLDGVGFSKALKGFKEPRDERVHNAIAAGAQQIVERYSLLGAYIVSDEVNILVYPNTPYAGRVEKIISIFSSIMSSRVSLVLSRQLFFDSRIIQLENINEAVEYILFRARIGLGNYIGSIARKLKVWVERRPRIHEQLKILEEKGIRILDDSEWKALGSSITWSEVWVEKEDPLTRQHVRVKRRRIRIDPGPWRLLEIVEQEAVKQA